MVREVMQKDFISFRAGTPLGEAAAGFLPYFQSACLETSLAQVTAELKRVERSLHARRPRTTPEAADPFGKNLRPATLRMRTSATGNLLNLTASGINRLDVWVSPKLIDFSKKMEVRLNDKPVQSVAVSVSAADLDADGSARITVGKKRHGLVQGG